MAVALQRLVRRALLTRLKADTDLTALVPTGSINPAGQPTWPFIVLRAPVSRRLRAACLNGGEGSWDVHAFARPRIAGGAEVTTAEDHAGLIGAAIETALSDRWLELEGGGRVHIELNDIRLLPDAEPEAYHWFAQCNWRVLAQ